MPSGVQLTASLRGATLVRMGLEDLKTELPRVGAARMYAAMQRAQTELRKPGKRPTYPIKWETERQRRAYFATNGFGGGIPSHRTGKYEKGFQIRRNTNGYALFNRTPYTKYVGGSADGTGQSFIHLDRWVLIRDAVDRAVRRLPQDVREDVFMVARRRIG